MGIIRVILALALVLGGNVGNWKVIAPTTTTNLCTNPSFETGTTGWTTGGANTIAQSSAQSKFGLYSLLCTFVVVGSSTMAEYAITLTAATTYTISAWIYVPSDFDIWAGETIYMWTANFTGDTDTMITSWTKGVDPEDTWFRLEMELTIAADPTGQIRLGFSAHTPTNGRFIYVDAMQIETGADLSTYCDGDQPGCAWNGAAHASTSWRSAAYRGGGSIKDLKDDYGFAVETAIGVGMPPVTLSHDSYSLLPGGELNGVKTEIRPFTLQGNIRGTGSPCNIHPPRNVLEKLFAHDTYPKSGDGWQPIRLRYTGAAVTKEADAHYARGLGGALSTEALKSGVEKVAIGFEQPAVYWCGIGNGSQVLDSNDSATLRYATGRLKSTGQWDDLGLGANPTTAGGSVVYAIAVGPDGKVYYGGNFTGWGAVAGRDYIAAYDPATDTWETVGGASDFNGTINGLLFGADGTLYAVGEFTNAAGDANADYIAQKPSGGAWAALGQPVQGAAAITSAIAIAIDSVGDILIGGNFTDWANVANADHFVKWDVSGSAYVAVGSGGTSSVFAIAVDSDDNYHIGGSFTIWAGVAGLHRWAFWDGSSWVNPVATSPNNPVYDFEFDSNNVLHIVGLFGTIDGVTVAGAASFNGVAISPLGSGLGGNAGYSISIGPDGMIYVAGSFTSAGGLTRAQRVARWNGSSWAQLDLDLPGTPTVRVVLAGNADPVISSNYDVWIGYSGTGTGTFAGLTTTTNDGNTPVYPQLVVNRSGGTTAILETLRNESTGLELLLDYSLLDGETLTIDLDPQAKTIISSMFGSRPDAMLAGSDFGEWALLPDANDVTCFVSTSGGPTVLAYLIWPLLYKGID